MAGIARNRIAQIIDQEDEQGGKAAPTDFLPGVSDAQPDQEQIQAQ